ncbi:MAG: hypothetical protein U9R08_03565 [Nanoarchaeota archaeon]|nr:hypothetical protein [Nanoarchaeota archaeon]
MIKKSLLWILTLFICIVYAQAAIYNTTVDIHASSINMTMFVNSTQDLVNVTVYPESITLRNWTFAYKEVPGVNTTIMVNNDYQKNYSVRAESNIELNFTMSGIPNNYVVQYNGSIIEGNTDGNFSINATSQYNILNFFTNIAPTANITLKDNQDIFYTNFTNITGQVRDEMYLILSNFNSTPGIKEVHFDITNSSGDSIESSVHTYSGSDMLLPFTLNDYTVNNYEIILYDNNLGYTTYTGTLQAKNVDPNITGIESFRNGAPNSCQRDTSCYLYVDISEDGCDITSIHSIKIYNGASGVLAMSDSTWTYVTEYDKNKCYFKTLTWYPSAIGQYDVNITYEDSFGKQSNVTKSMNVQTRTTPATGGGGGGGDDYPVESMDNITYRIDPRFKKINVQPGQIYDIEFKIINEETETIQPKVSVVKSVENPEVYDWIYFDDFKEIIVTVPSSGGLTENVKYVRPQVRVPSEIAVGEYLGYISVAVDGNVQLYEITVNIRENILQQFVSYLNTDIYEIPNTNFKITPFFIGFIVFVLVVIGLSVNYMMKNKKKKR